MINRVPEPPRLAFLAHVGPHLINFRFLAAAQEAAAPPPPIPPPPSTSNRGRPRQVDTSQHFCPNPNCAYQGRAGLGNSSANGHPSGGLWRQLYCSQCEGYVLETHGTIFS